MNEDAELLRRFAETHAEEAFAQLVQRHLGLVYHTALRRTNGDAHLAQDIAQQVFLTLAKEARILTSHAVLSGWLYVTTRHVAANVMRSESRRRSREIAAHALHALSDPGVGGAEWEHIRPEIDAAMDGLSGPDRDAVLLRFFENESFSGIGETLQISADAARMRVDRALEKLRLLLSRRGIDSTAAALGSVLASQAAGAAPAGLAASLTSTALGISATAVATTSFWTLMTTTKTLTMSAAAVALMGVGAGVYEASGFSKSSASLAAAELRYNEAMAHLKESESEIAQLRNTLTQRSNEISSAIPGTISGTANTGSNQATQKAANGALSGAKNTTDILFSDPEYQQLSSETYRVSLKLSNALFYRQARLSPETVAELEKLLMESQQIGTDVMAAARAQGMSLADVQFAKVAGDAHKAVEAQIISLLGAETYSQFKSYRAGSNARRSVDQLASNLYFTDTPLTFAQADELTKIVSAQSIQPQSTGMVGAMPVINWDAVITESGKILLPDQTHVLRMLGEQSIAQRKMTELHNRLLSSAAVQNPSNGNSAAK